jgi:hypothetical protein
MLYSAWNIKDTKISTRKFSTAENSDRAFEEEVMLSGFWQMHRQNQKVLL